MLAGVGRLLIAIAALAVWMLPIFAHARVTFAIAMLVAAVVGVMSARQIRIDAWLQDATSLALLAALLALAGLLLHPAWLVPIVSRGISWRTLGYFAFYGTLWLAPVATALVFVSRARWAGGASVPPEAYYYGYDRRYL